MTVHPGHVLLLPGNSRPPRGDAARLQPAAQQQQPNADTSKWSLPDATSHPDINALAVTRSRKRTTCGRSCSASPSLPSTSNVCFALHLKQTFLLLARTRSMDSGFKISLPRWIPYSSQSTQSAVPSTYRPVPDDQKRRSPSGDCTVFMVVCFPEKPKPNEPGSLCATGPVE